MDHQHITYLKNYQPPKIVVHSIDLDFDLYEEHTIVKQALKLSLKSQHDLLLNGEELELLELKINDETWPKNLFKITEQELIIFQCPKEATLKITTKIYPSKNTHLSGLYEVNGLFCTQCEAEGFRRITYFPDRPDVMTFYTTTIHANKITHPVLLSNGNLIASGAEDNGRHFATWNDPFKKPSYLFALVAGNLASYKTDFVTKTGRNISLECYVNNSQENLCQHALESLKKAMQWDEDTYEREYDLDRYMIVAIHEFNMGAMENKGLNVFNAQYVLADPKLTTDNEYLDIETVIAHEYFHNWTGNRITCRDWFQLSLKEGLTIFRDQEFSRDMHSRDVKRIHDVKQLLVSQFPEDAGSMAHPVRPTEYQTIDNFYTATIYNKGAEVIRMLETLLGVAGFRSGMQKYFALFDGQAVTIDDFIFAMENANNINLNNFKQWYNQIGTPILKLEHESFAKGTYKLTLSQQNLNPKNHALQAPLEIPIKIALFSPKGQQLQDQPELIILNKKQQVFKFNNLQEKPIVSLLRDFSAPVILEAPYNEEDLITLLTHETNGYAKWQAARILITKCIQQNYQSSQEIISNKLLHAFKYILLDTRLDLQLRAELLTPPAYEEIITGLAEIDVTKIIAARNNFKATFSKYMLPFAEKYYHGLIKDEPKERALKNVCLTIMMWADPCNYGELCLQQLENSNNMTNRLAAYYLLAQSNNPELQTTAHDYFYQLTIDHELVYNKWLLAHCMNPMPNVINDIKNLTNHPRFSYKVPNQVRALIGGLILHNPAMLHNADFSGYEFLKEQLLTLDKINPHVAARLAAPFSRWQNLNKPRQNHIKKIVTDLLKLPISNNLREIIYLRKS